MTQETSGSSHLMRPGLWPLCLSSPALPEEAPWEGGGGMLVTEGEGERPGEAQEAPLEADGGPHLAVLSLTLAPQGSCFDPRWPRISLELIIW